MEIVQLIDEDFVNYKKASMVIGFPNCSFKCDIECGKPVCQNSALASASKINIDTDNLITRYLNNDITSSIVCQGLEPFDSWDDLYEFISKLRDKCDDDIVIYTGYKEDEINNEVLELKRFKNIIIKFGRFIPDHSAHYDEVLGVKLASDNQYAIKIS